MYTIDTAVFVVDDADRIVELDESAQEMLGTDDGSHLERAERAHDRMDRLIEDLLVLARQSELSLAVESVDLAASAEASWEYVETDGATSRPTPVRSPGQTPIDWSDC